MTGLVLTPRGAFEARVDMSGVLPSAGSDLARLKIGYGGSRVELGELFAVTGAADHRLTIEDGGAELDRIGFLLSEGEIIVKGDVGSAVGLRATGGVIVVKGSAGDFAAADLFGGKVAIAGDVGDWLAAATEGSKRGMSGGIVVVGGSAGKRAGERLRGGVVLIEGDAAENAASDMIAGTLAVLGKLGGNAGRGMKRGTLFVSSPEGLASGFADAGEHDLVMLRVLAKRSHEVAHVLGKATVARRYPGDLNVCGKGEALILKR